MNCPACDHVNVDGARYCAKCGALMPVGQSEGDDALIGQVVGGRYRVTGLLGEGGMGRVYTAEQQMGTAVRKVAVKTLLQEFSKDPQVVARFMRECGTVVELEHPNTIKFFDFGQTDQGDLYIAMEFVDGKPLADVIENEGAMSFERVDRILKQISGSLHEAHEKGIVHRDLKPENVILTTRAGEEDFVKVLDFGIAKRNDAADAAKEQKLTQAGMVLGTPPYMSPEQFTGKELGRRSDIYSLGVMAYEMLTGKLPFKANTPWEWATQHMTVQPHPFEETNPMASQIPPHIKEACMRALSKDQEKRQDTAKAFYLEFKGGGARQSVTQVPGSAPMSLGGQNSATEAFVAPVGGPGAANPRPAGAGATQIGEPFIPPPDATAGGHQNVPTAGGQAIPASPAAPAPARSSGGGDGGSKGMYIGAAVVVALLIGVGAFAMSGNGGEDEHPPIIDVNSKGGDKDAKDETNDEDDGSSSPDDSSGESTSSGGDTDPQPATDPEPTDPQPTDPQPPDPQPPVPQPPVTPPSPQPPYKPPPPPPPPKPDGSKACARAIALAQASKCPEARSAMGSCSGPQRGAAQSAVGSCKQTLKRR